MFSRDEKKQEDMRISLKSDKLKFYIGDVRQYDSVHDALKGVNCVFHAAALKHVPSCEFYPMEAVRTNAMGAENAMRASMDHGVSRSRTIDKLVHTGQNYDYELNEVFFGELGIRASDHLSYTDLLNRKVWHKADTP